MNSLPIVALMLLLGACTTRAKAEEWKQFRGSVGGNLTAIDHPTDWSEQANLAWSVPMRGSGWSSPVVVENRIFLTFAESDSNSRPKGMAAGVASMRSFRNAEPAKYRFVVACHSLKDGEQLWEKTVGEAVPTVIHPSNTYATESPATDGERLFSFFATTGTLNAWDVDGNEIWRQELGVYKSGNGFGTGSSLTTFDGRVYVQYDNDEKSFVAAFDAQTGQQVWRDDQRTKTSWSSPLIWSHAGGQELVACGSDVVTSYDPADGTVIWRLTGMRTGFSGSPAIDAERIYFGNSGPMSAGPLVAVGAATKGEIELDDDFDSENVAWSRIKSGPGMASPTVANGFLYIPGSGGILNCYNTKTGERMYRTRVQNMKTVVASLWADEDHVFILDEAGTTHIIQPGPEFKLLGTNKIDDLVWSTPAVVGDALLIRGVERLYCIRN